MISWSQVTEQRLADWRQRLNVLKRLYISAVIRGYGANEHEGTEEDFYEDEDAATLGLIIQR
jgi:hypothetical protein